MTDPIEERVSERVARLMAALEDIQLLTEKTTADSPQLIETLRRNQRMKDARPPTASSEND